MGPLDGLSQQDKERLLKLLKEQENRNKYSGHKKWFKPGTIASIENLPKHAAFFAAGAKHQERLLMGGNRTGKTIGGSYESSVHLTGQYPDWWKGRVFDKPTFGWAMGKTSQTVKETIQKELLGPPGEYGLGMIPKNCIVKLLAKPGTPNGVEEVLVKHVSGGISRLSFKSYEQSLGSFMGTAMDFVWCDEEPPHLWYNECCVRLMTTNGIIYVTCTPLDGVTAFIQDYAKDADHLMGAFRIVVPEESTL